MFKIRKIKILIIIFLLGIMLFSCDYPMGGKMIEPYYYNFYYEINDNRLVDNKVLIGFGIDYYGQSINSIHGASISVYVDNDESPIDYYEFDNEEMLSDKFNLLHIKPRGPEDYNNITQINLIDYDIKEYIKIVFVCKDASNPPHFAQLYIKTTKIDNDLYIYDYEFTHGMLEE